MQRQVLPFIKIANSQHHCHGAGDHHGGKCDG